MRFKYAREAVAAVSVVTLGAVGVVFNVTSLSGRTVLAAVALSSFVILQRLWRDPAQTMSERIQEARR
jgi:hypothetical protein